MTSSYLKTELSTKDISKMECAMVPASRFGLMAPSTKVNGARTRLMALESSGTQTAMSTKASGRTTKLTAMASTFMSTAPNTKATGRTTCKMETVLNHGRTALVTMVATRKA